jgi:hypothetical protein
MLLALRLSEWLGVLVAPQESLMSKTIRYWCDSGANIHSIRKGETTLDELGLSEAEWDAMTDDERDNLMRDVACERLDWGYALEDA